MAAYILRRLLLIIPTLFGIMLLNFAVIQFAPGGPVEQLIAELQEGATGGESGGPMAFSADCRYRGRQGIDPALIAGLEGQFVLARILCAGGHSGTPTAADPRCE